jgi:hypothetical protein
MPYDREDGASVELENQWSGWAAVSSLNLFGLLGTAFQVPGIARFLRRFTARMANPGMSHALSSCSRWWQG